MKVRIEDLLVGDRLLANVFNPSGLHVLSGDTVLTAEDIEKLHNHQIEYVDIAFREQYEAPFFDNPHIEQLVRETGPKFESAVKGVHDFFEQVREEGQLEQSSVDQLFDPLIGSIQTEPDFVGVLLLLNNQDEYTYQHSVQVGMISYTIARWLGKDEKEAGKIGKAGYLHDIGKCKIDPDILNKPGSLTKEEFEWMKGHTTYGYSILSRSFPKTPEYGLVALQHHERLDGSGYPRGLTDEDIHEYARIVAVADIYSAMISSRAYQKKRDMLYVLRELHRLSFWELDPVIVHTFISNMMPNFIGKRVIMNDGQTGTIIMNNPHDPFRPLVKIAGQFVDLSKDNEQSIETIFV